MEQPAGLREAHLCAAWEQGLVDPKRLLTTAGLLLHVVYPGRRGGDPGPDFRDAVIALPDATLLRGDVEVHLEHAGWRLHGHAQDPAYDKVILHLTWDAGPEVVTQSGRQVLSLALTSCLGVTPEALAQLPARTLPVGPSCPASLPKAGYGALPAFLEEQGRQRLAARAAAMSAEAAAVGDDQVLWTALLRGLGYHRNSGPFERLARSVPWTVAVGVFHEAKGATDLEAVLLGAAGFLEATDRALPPPDDARRRVLRARWQKLRPWLRDRPLVRTDWTFAGVRPDNAPPRRIAAAVGIALRYVDGLADGLSRQVGLADIPFAFDLTEDPYWRGHADLGRAVGPKPVSVLGAARERELLVNAVLPVVLAMAQRDGAELLEQAVFQRFRSLRAAGGNQITRHMLQTINAPARVAATAAAEQGLLHLYHGWCRERRCWQCPVPMAFSPATIAPQPVGAEGDTP